MKLPPTEQFPDQDPCTAGADTRKAREPRNRGLRTAAHLALLLYLERPDLPGSEQQPFEFAFDLGAQGWQQLCGVLRPPERPRAATDSLGPQVVEHQQR
ncbi:hypothetical protein M3I54_40285, partial [Paraburkholderia sp. CNPSo 3274]|uniref:hypothetical protein n=1 Tax=Paraburkholderia sp. CNPSo 3274 TaxID=2940932 RepID=UPI0020B7BD1F